MAKKSREPQRLGNADYGKWFEQMFDLKTREVAAGTWPTHLDTDLDALAAAMWDVWDDYDRQNNELRETTYPAYNEASKTVMKRLQSFRELLPTLFDGDDAVLGEFGISREIPRDKEDLFTVASGCIEHWNDINVPPPPPEYLPVEAMFAEFAVEYDAFQAAYTAYIAKTRDVEEAQNLFLEKREACHHAERLIFHWYKGLHLDGDDEWWTATPWGTVSGGSGGGGEEPGSWEDAPTNFTVREGMGGVAHMEANIHKDADGVAIYQAETEMGVTTPPTQPSEPVEPQVPFPYDHPVPFNVRVWLWICHVKDGVKGAVAGPEWFEIEK